MWLGAGKRGDYMWFGTVCYTGVQLGNSFNLTTELFNFQMLMKMTRSFTLSAKDLLNEPELTNMAILDQHHSGKNFIWSRQGLLEECLRQL